MIHLFTVVTPYMIGTLCRELRESAANVMQASALEYRFQRKHYDNLKQRREGLGYRKKCIRERVSELCLGAVWRTHQDAETMVIFWMRTMLCIIPPNYRRSGLYRPDLDMEKSPYAERRFNAGTLTRNPDRSFFRGSLN